MNAPSSRVAAFSLVEVTLALGVTAFCMIAIFGLLPVGFRCNQTAAEQTVANGILSAVIVDLRATPPTFPPGRAAVSEQFSIPIPVNPVTVARAAITLYFPDSGTASDTLLADSRYRLTVNFPPNGSNAKAATFVNLQVSWPAAVPPLRAVGRVQTFVALDRN